MNSLESHLSEGQAKLYDSLVIWLSGFICNALGLIFIKKKRKKKDDVVRILETHVSPNCPLYPHHTFTNISLPLWPAISSFHLILFLFHFHTYTNAPLSHSLNSPTGTPFLTTPTIFSDEVY